MPRSLYPLPSSEETRVGLAKRASGSYKYRPEDKDWYIQLDLSGIGVPAEDSDDDSDYVETLYEQIFEAELPHKGRAKADPTTQSSKKKRARADETGGESIAPPRSHNLTVQVPSSVEPVQGGLKAHDSEVQQSAAGEAGFAITAGSSSRSQKKSKTH